MLHETIAIYAIIDDLLTAIGHREENPYCQLKERKGRFLVAHLPPNEPLGLVVPLPAFHQSGLPHRTGRGVERRSSD
jgi:hypothetical protein